MLKSEKKVISMEVIKMLIELFPSMTVKEAIEYIEMALLVKESLGIDVIGVTDVE